MSSFSESASCQNQLEAGLMALQSGQTESAIVQLNRCLTSPDLNSSDAVKAKMGLVQAYAQSGEIQSAIALCQELHQSHHEKVRAWATQMMTKLAPIDPGFVPLDATVQPVRRKRATPSQQNAATIQTEPLSEPARPETISAITPHAWKNADRAQRWHPLPPLNPMRLRCAEVGSAIALFMTLCLLWQVVGFTFSLPHTAVARLLRWSIAAPDQTIPILQFGLSLMLLFFASPWILDAVLKGLYGLKPLSTAAIARHSVEAHRLIQRFAQQEKIPIPKLGILPTSVPIAVTYGCLPKFARIVVSQGLLDQLTDEEIAAIYAGEVSHIAHWDFAWMSLVAVVLQIPYSIYQLSAISSDRLRALKLNQAFVSKLIQIAADVTGLISAIAYGFFWVFRWSGLWLSRERIIYSDRQACSLTGNPNGLARTLIKLTIATTKTIKHEKRTSYLLEGFELLNPVSYRSAILFEGLFDRVSLSTLFQWDFANCDRSLSLLDSPHALMGTRLQKLMNCCQQWHLKPELDLETLTPTNRKQPLLQFAPLFGGLGGIAISALLWLIAHALFAIGNFRLNWLASDYSLFPSFGCIGFGIGMIIRFNRFFPDSQDAHTDLVQLLTQPQLTPLDSPRIRLEGTLIGRTGASNRLAQDLLLQTETGLIKLHYCSQLGAIGNLLCSLPLGQPAIVTGWLRRSATPWIDVDTIKTRSLIRAGHPVWSLLVAIAAILFGIAQIL
ncbi:M48 family metalloprotease [Leptolyngbya sp. DQ-M1]|uniref:M48 family metalloprotease n=1 Tax=Leptolyngbya sp. DQ-M1 TaxID=2933920 RepID=UPI003298CE39